MSEHPQEHRPGESVDPPVPRVVLDTNVLIAAARARGSASRRLLESCRQQTLTPIISPPLQREYDWIAQRALRGLRNDTLLTEWSRHALLVEADPAAHPFPDDPEDAKVLATAVAGGAAVLVTNDRPLLRLDPYQGIRVLRPGDAVRWLEPPP